jgi:tetratricopeptide (TPR) repeat protein
MNPLIRKLSSFGSLCFACTHAAAQSLTCAVTDELCLQQEYEEVCRNSSTVESCSAWLRSIQQSPQSAHPNLQLAAAAAHLAISDLTAGPAAKTPSRERAAALYAAVAQQDPTNARALLGLAALLDSRDEKIELMRRVVDLDPGNVMNLEMLAIVIGMGGSQTDLAESAELMERAYELQPNGTKRWTLATEVILKYETASLRGRAEEFRVRAQAAIAPERLLRETAQASASTSDRAEDATQQLCTIPIIAIVGAETCLEAARNVVNAANSARGSTVQSLGDAALEVMKIASANSALLDAVDPDWRAEFEAATDGFLATQTALPRMYVNAAAITKNGARRISIMKAAAARFPNDPDVAFALGLAHLDQRNKSDAIDALSRAQVLLPVERRLAVNQFLQRASELPND